MPWELPVEKHFHVHQDNSKPLVLYREPLGDNLWERPVQLFTWGRGYAYVLSSTGPLWIPAKAVKLYHELAHPAYQLRSKV